MNLFRKLIPTSMSLIMIISALIVFTITCSIEGNAASVVEEGDAGALHYVIDSDDVLTITGSGEMTESTWNTVKNQPLIKRVIIEEGVTSIMANAFKECYKMQEIRIPNTVQSIGVGAFYDCVSLKKITLPNTIKNIERTTFMGCTNLERINMPESIESIGGCAFTGCKSLKTLYIPISVTSIPNTGSEGSFMNCSPNMVLYCGAWKKPGGWNNNWNIYNYGSGFYQYLTVEYDVTPEQYFSLTHVHIYGDWTVTKKATCSEDGSRYKECEECEDRITETISKKGHAYNAWNTTKKATELAAGQKSRTCSRCGNKQMATIAQLKPSLPAIVVTNPTAAKKAATIKWKKVSKANQKRIASIQIQYSMDKSFKKGVKTTTAKKTAASKTITKLTSKKMYYVRVRAYKKDSKGVHISKWSAVKVVRAK